MSSQAADLAVRAVRARKGIRERRRRLALVVVFVVSAVLIALRQHPEEEAHRHAKDAKQFPPEGCVQEIHGGEASFLLTFAAADLVCLFLSARRRDLFINKA